MVRRGKSSCAVGETNRWRRSSLTCSSSSPRTTSRPTRVSFWRWPMSTAGSAPQEQAKPLWLLAELTYRCPLQCFYCSNPLDFALYQDELSTADWLQVLQQGRALGAAQLGLSGGEPLVRKDLEVLVAEARRLGYYSNLI